MSLRMSGRALRSDGLDARKTYAKTLTRCPEVEILLHAQKKFGAPSRELSKSQGHVGGNGTPAAQYRMQSLATHPHAARRLRYGQARMLFNDLTHQLTWMSRCSSSIADCEFSSYSPLYLMILLQVHPQGSSVSPFESDTPRTIYMDRVSLRLAMKCMEIESGLP